MDDAMWLDATAQADLVRRREVKAEELVEAALARIDRLNPALNAVVSGIDPAPAEDGPFSGVPFLVKDLLLEVAGTHCTNGSRWLSGHVSTQDQELAIRYRRAGLVIVGRTNTSEFGFSPTCEPFLFGPTRNPWDLGRSTGGSSGGSAAAVAAGLVPIAHGNDLGGSIRYPAAWCGLFGFKPTRGRVPLGPRYGDIVSGFASEHVLTRSVRDSAALLDAVTGPASGDPYPVPPHPQPFLAGAAQRPLRIAVSTRPRGGQRVDPAWELAVERAAKLLEQLGHTVEEGLPEGLDAPAYGASLKTVYMGAVAWIIGHWCRRTGRPPAEGEIEPQTRAYWEEGCLVTAAGYLAAIEQLQCISRRVATWFTSYDVWLTPTVGAPPPALGDLVGTAEDPLRGSRNVGRYLMFDAELANVTGNPAMSIPFGFDDHGLPLGVHCLGRHGDESTLFQLAAQLEEAVPWAGTRPTFPAARRAAGAPPADQAGLAGMSRASAAAG